MGRHVEAKMVGKRTVFVDMTSKKEIEMNRNMKKK